MNPKILAIVAAFAATPCLAGTDLEVVSTIPARATISADPAGDISVTFDRPIEVDIKQFVDSTPKASVDFGRTAVLSDSQQLQRGDVDGDGVPDFVIAHRRKLCTSSGPSAARSSARRARRRSPRT